MKTLHIKKKHLLIITSIIIIFTFTFCMFPTSFGMQHYYKLDFSTGLVTATTLNVRSGPGTGYKTISQVKKDSYIRIFAGVGDWYIVQVEGDFVGAVNKKYVKPIYLTTGNNNTNTSGSSNSSNGTTNTNFNTDVVNLLNSDEQEVFNLINKQRNQNGLSSLSINSEVQNVARIKAKDMVDNNYFSHTSPTYGSPFDMLKSFSISYKTAGENIAGNSSNSGAVTAWMNSPGHKANILNNSFNQTGIGVVSSPKYGKIYVQMFIGK